MGPTQALQIGSALVFSCTEGEVYTRLLSEYRRAEHNMHPTFGDSTALHMYLLYTFVPGRGARDVIGDVIGTGRPCASRSTCTVRTSWGLTKATKVEETPAAKCHFPPTMRRGGCPAQHNVAMGPPESRARFPGRRKDTFLKEKPCPSFVCGTLAFCRQTKQASSRPVLHEVSGIGTHFSPPRRPLPLTLTANESAERKSKANYGGRRCIRFVVSTAAGRVVRHSPTISR